MASRNLTTSCSISRKYCPLLVFINSAHLPVVTSPIFVSKVMWDEDREKIRSESFTLLSSFDHLATLSFILSNRKPTLLFFTLRLYYYHKYPFSFLKIMRQRYQIQQEWSMTAVIESNVGSAVHTETLYLSLCRTLVVLGRGIALLLVAVVVFSPPKIITLIFFCDIIIISNNCSGCQIVVIITNFRCWRYGNVYYGIVRTDRTCKLWTEND